MKIGKVLCAVGLHRWRQVRLLKRISPIGTNQHGADFAFRVVDAETVTECARCRVRRMEET